MDYLSSLVKASRPKQWIKNLLVAAAPIAASQFGSQKTKIILGVVGFTAASIIGYLINDWIDKESDRNHPKKQFRPFASGKLNFYSLVFLLMINTLVVIRICLFLPKEYTLTIIVYLLLTLTYSLYIKSKPVIEMIWLASGFLIRAIAGSAIIQEAPTGWFIVAVGFGALFVVSAKRLAELKNNHQNKTRLVISKYNESFLNLVLTTSVSITLLTYALWVFQVHPNSILAQFTILPFTLSVLLYAWHCENGDAESPESLIYKDKLMLVGIFLVITPLIFIIYK